MKKDKSVLASRLLVTFALIIIFSSCNKRVGESYTYTGTHPPAANAPEVTIDTTGMGQEQEKIFVEDTISEKDFRTLNDSAITRFKNGEAFKAYLLMNGSIRINPNNADSYYIRGLVSQTAFNLFYGKSDFEKALELNPNHVDALMKLAIIYGKDGKRELACQYFKKACNLGNSDACEGYSRFCK